MASRRQTSRFRRQAQLAADLATDPQASVLRQALVQAATDYGLGTRQARGASLMVQKLAQTSTPQIQGYYDDAQKKLQANLSSVGINPVTVTGPAQADIADTLNRLTTSSTGAKTELTQRANDAAAGLQFQLGNLASQYGSSVNKINTQLADLAGQKGKTAESTLLTLLNQQAGRDVTLRGQNLSHADRQAAADATAQYRGSQIGLAKDRIDVSRGIDPVTGKRLKGSGKKTKTAEPEAAVKLKRDIQNAQGLLKQGHSVRYLSHTLNAPPDVLQAATDLQDFGHLMPDTVNNLRRLKVRVPRSWLPAKSNIPSNKR